MTPRQLYESQLEIIQRVIDWIRARHSMRREEGEDFSSWVHLRLLDQDCSVLAKFEGKSKLATYLTTVINNLCKDYLIARNSKWRASARAKELGWQAVALEAEIVRHGRTVDDAVQLVGQQSDVGLAEKELTALAAELPPRTRRIFVGEGSLAQLDSGLSSQREAETREARAEARRVSRALREALGSLPRRDVLVLRLRFREGQKIVSIARLLGLDAKRLYPHLSAILGRLRQELESRGVAWPAVQEGLTAELELDLALEPGTAWDSDSLREDAGPGR